MTVLKPISSNVIWNLEFGTRPSLPTSIKSFIYKQLMVKGNLDH